MCTHTHTHKHTHFHSEKEQAAQGNVYVDDEQKLKPINHFDLFLSFFRLKLILMPSVAKQRGQPGTISSVRGRKHLSERERLRDRQREGARERESERDGLLLLCGL